MKKSLKWFFLLISPFLLVMLAILSHSLWLPILAQRMASKALGAEVHIQSVKVGYVNPMPVTVRGLTIENLGSLEKIQFEFDFFKALNNYLDFPKITFSHLKLSKANDVTTNQSLSLPDIQGSLSARYQKDSIECENLNFFSEGLSLSGKASIKELSQPVPDIDLDMEGELDFDRLGSVFDHVHSDFSSRLAGSVFAKVNVKSSESNKMSVAGHLRPQNVTVALPNSETLLVPNEAIDYVTQLVFNQKGQPKVLVVEEINLPWEEMNLQLKSVSLPLAATAFQGNLNHILFTQRGEGSLRVDLNSFFSKWNEWLQLPMTASGVVISKVNLSGEHNDELNLDLNFTGDSLVIENSDLPVDLRNIGDLFLNSQIKIIKESGNQKAHLEKLNFETDFLTLKGKGHLNDLSALNGQLSIQGEMSSIEDLRNRFFSQVDFDHFLPGGWKLGNMPPIPFQTIVEKDGEGIHLFNQLSGKIKLTSPMMALNHPLHLENRLSFHGQYINSKRIEAMLGEAAHPLMNMSIGEAFFSLDQPSHLNLSGKLSVALEEVENVLTDDGKKDLGKFQLTGPLDLEFQIKRQDIQVVGDFSSTVFQVDDWIEKKRGVPLKLFLQMSQPVSDFDLKFLGQSIAGQFDWQARNFKIPDFAIDLEKVSGIFPIIESQGVKGTVAARASGSWDKGKKLDVSWQAGEISYRDLSLEKNDVELSYADNKLEIKKMNGVLNGGTVQVVGSKSFGELGPLNFSIDVDRVNLDVELIEKSSDAFWLFRLIKDIVFKIVPGVTGKLSGHFQIESKGLLPDELLEHSLGQADFSLKEAQVSNPKWLEKFSHSLLVAADLLKISDPEKSGKFKRVGELMATGRFDKVRARLKIQGKHVLVKLELMGPLGTPGLVAIGQVLIDEQNVPASSCQFKVTFENLSASDQYHFEELTKIAFDDDAIPLGSTLDNLAIDFDPRTLIKGLVRNQARKKIEKEVDHQLREAAEKALGDVFDKILGGK